MALTASQTSFFKEHGYLLLRDAIDLTTTSAMLKAINRDLAFQLMTNANLQGFSTSVPENRPNNGKFIVNTSSPLVIDQFFLAAETTSAFISKVLCLFPNLERQALAEAQIALRFPLEGEPESTSGHEGDHWHIDGQWESNIPQFSVLVGVYLTPAPKSWAGNLTVFPKSHFIVQSLLQADKERFCAQLRTKIAPKLDIEPLQLTVFSGDIAILHPLLAHRAGLNFSPNIRSAVYYRLKTRNFGAETQEKIIKDLFYELNSERDTLEPAPSKIIFVTGANRGIGLALCKKILFEYRDQDTVLLMGVRNLMTGRVVMRELRLEYTDSKVKVHLMYLDMTDRDSIRTCFNEVAQNFRKFDVLVNCAAIRSSSLEQFSREEVINTNFEGLVASCQAAEKIMRGGLVINLTSFAGRNCFFKLPTETQRSLESTLTLPYEEGLAQLRHVISEYSTNPDTLLDKFGNLCGPYEVSKMGVDFFTRMLSAKLSTRGASVHAVDPGVCRTQIGSKTSKRSPEEAAETPFFLLTSDLIQIGTGNLWWNSTKVSWKRPLWIAICGVGGCGKTTMLVQLEKDVGGKVIIDELSAMDYRECGGSREKFLTSTQEEKDEYHRKGRECLVQRQNFENLPVVFATHASVMIKGKPTPIMKREDVSCFTHLVYLDYDLDTVYARQVDDQVRKRNLSRDVVREWLEVEKKEVERISNGNAIELVCVKAEDDLLQVVRSLLLL